MLRAQPQRPYTRCHLLNQLHETLTLCFQVSGFEKALAGVADLVCSSYDPTHWAAMSSFLNLVERTGHAKQFSHTMSLLNAAYVVLWLANCPQYCGRCAYTQLCTHTEAMLGNVVKGNARMVSHYVGVMCSRIGQRFVPGEIVPGVPFQ